MIVLGIDPGVERIGFAVLSNSKHQSKNINYLHSGIIITAKNSKKEQRFLTIYNDIQKVVAKYRPNCLILEEIFYSKNVKTATSVAQAQGVIYLLAGQLNLPLYTLTPNSIKLAVTGYGNADKRAVQKMVTLQLAIPKKKRLDDEYDAIACAFSHLLIN